MYRQAPLPGYAVREEAESEDTEVISLALTVTQSVVQDVVGISIKVYVYNTISLVWKYLIVRSVTKS